MQYQLFTHIDPDTIYYRQMCALHDRIFQPCDSQTIIQELVYRKNVLIVLAQREDEILGYKIGYEDRNNRFYSWLGGVDPDARGQGIASELMRQQHGWCQKQGYHAIRTQTKNKWREMLILNLRHGFNIIGTYTDKTGDTKIILGKSLIQDGDR